MDHFAGGFASGTEDGGHALDVVDLFLKHRFDVNGVETIAVRTKETTNREVFRFKEK
jgi:hypothetical protein